VRLVESISPQNRLIDEITGEPTKHTTASPFVTLEMMLMSTIAQASAPSTQPNSYKYKAFISYKRNPDLKIAEALQSALHRIGRPWYKPYAMRVFRDKTDVELSHKLWPVIERGLEQSEYLILLASPQAAQSFWVQKEISYWIKHRPLENLLIILTNGEIVWGAQDYDWELTNALPQLLQGRYTEVPGWLELDWARTSEDLSLRQPQFKEAAAELSARLQGKEKAEVISEDVRQYRRARKLAWSAVLALLLLTTTAVSAAVFAFQQRDLAEARRQEAVRAAEEARKATQVAEEERTKAQHATEAEKTAKESAEDRRKEAERQTKIAEQNKVEAEKEKNMAEIQKSLALENANRLRHSVYVADMNVAAREYELGNYENGNKVLSKYLLVDENGNRNKDFRDFSWFWLWKKYYSQNNSENPIRLNLQIYHSAILLNTIALSKDSEILASGSSQGEINLWRVGNREPTVSLGRQEGEIISLRFSFDGKTLSSVSVEYQQGVDDILDQDQQGDIYTIKLWDLTKIKEIQSIKFKSTGPILLSPDGKLFSYYHENKIIIGDVTTAKIMRKIKSPDYSLYKWGNNGKMILHVDGNSKIKIYDVQTGKLMRRIDKFSNAEVTTVAISPDGEKMVSGGRWGYLLGLNVETGREVELKLVQGTNNVIECFFSGDSKTVIVLQENGKITLYNWETGGEMPQLKGTEEPSLLNLSHMILTSNGLTLAGWNEDGQIILWKIADKLEATSIENNYQ
jgi:WD40 repeat protein